MYWCCSFSSSYFDSYQDLKSKVRKGENVAFFCLSCSKALDVNDYFCTVVLLCVWKRNLELPFLSVPPSSPELWFQHLIPSCTCLPDVSVTFAVCSSQNKMLLQFFLLFFLCESTGKGIFFFFSIIFKIPSTFVKWTVFQINLCFLLSLQWHS